MVPFMVLSGTNLSPVSYRVFVSHKDDYSNGSRKYLKYFPW